MATTATTSCWTTTAPLPAPGREIERLRAALAAREAECAKLAGVLDEFTHEYSPDSQRDGYCLCALRADDAEHSTPGALRRRYGFGAV